MRTGYPHTGQFPGLDPLAFADPRQLLLIHAITKLGGRRPNRERRTDMMAFSRKALVRRRTLRTILAGALGAGLLAGSASADQPGDAWITAQVKYELLADDAIEGMAVNVDTFEGIVTLHGKLQSEGEKTRAMLAAEKVDGVRGVRTSMADCSSPQFSRTGVASLSVGDPGK
jgi:hypothetical protein